MEPISLIHLDAEAAGVEGFDDAIPGTRLSPNLIHEDVPSYYRYTIATTRTEERLRIRGLVVGLPHLGTNPPLWIAIDTHDLDAILANQGGYLGNVADNNGIIHRLEHYDGPALDRVIAAILIDQPALTILERPGGAPVDLAPVFITSLEVAATCLRPAVTVEPSQDATARAKNWLLSLSTSQDAQAITDRVACYHTQEQEITFGMTNRSPRDMDKPVLAHPSMAWTQTEGKITWYPNFAALREIAASRDRALCFPANVALTPSTTILAGAWQKSHDMKAQ
ncbi:hypothetical protein [Ferrimicrobium sp.]|uniref:hypothetical protein n=1 Tax=Ferrimicrobium sp. TaxID=2926050 RepID=UPI002632FE1C|nr:hypothetical protein [Ferrimicrobium sp.]